MIATSQLSDSNDDMISFCRIEHEMARAYHIYHASFEVEANTEHDASKKVLKHTETNVWSFCVEFLRGSRCASLLSPSGNANSVGAIFADQASYQTCHPQGLSFSCLLTLSETRNLWSVKRWFIMPGSLAWAQVLESE